ncbi:MAG: hypothetical protein GX158_07535 [Bacteroidales bacterium]|nr:hypothetical protein [Bacteroidales bacterium]
MNKIDVALNGLLQKYDVKPDNTLNLLPGWNFIGKKLQNGDLPLLTWRVNRKFTELQKIVSAGVVEDVSMLRFSCFGSSDKWSLETLMYKEFDLCEFLTGGKIISLHATLSDNLAGNVIIKMDNGIIGSVEVGTQLPPRHSLIDRHEIIARRGVASDLVVDTQIPQSSIYTYTDQDIETYKDVDSELFGFDELEVEHIRSAFEVMKNPGIAPELILQHNHLSMLVMAAFESDRDNKKIEVN